jgi:ribonucleoside-diphosphate reductase alpha chain
MGFPQPKKETEMNLQDIPASTLLTKYGRGGENTPDAILDRVARGLTEAEADTFWEPIFRRALDNCLLGGRINASAGIQGVKTTWINCFVQPLADSVYEAVDGVPGIMEAARQAAQTMRLGGGVGYDFSPIRPKGAWINKTKSLASGPISYMEIFNSMCSTVISAGARRGAQMGILRCDHPDIEDFIVCKRVDDPNMPWDRRPFRNFNLSVGVTDALMQAVEADDEFELVHVAEPGPEIKANGAYQREDGLWVYRKVRARDLYDKIIRATYDRAEPGVVFLDRINQDNNLRYAETIAATNP